jgi:hypothetical protein
MGHPFFIGYALTMFHLYSSFLLMAHLSEMLTPFNMAQPGANTANTSRSAQRAGRVIWGV